MSVLSKGKICVVGPSIKMGGIERASCNLSNSLHELGCDITYVAIFKQPRFFKLNDGVEFIEPEGFNVSKLEFIRTILWLRRTIKEQDPDAVIVFNKFYSAITLLALLFSKIPVFISERSSPFYKWKWNIDYFNRLIFFLFPPDGVIAQTEVGALHQKKRFASHIPFKVIPNILREIKNYDIQRKNQVLAVGRLNDPIKGFDRLIHAWSRIHTAGWELLFAGGDEEGEKLKQLAKGLNIENSIRFLGKVAEIDRVYAEAKIFVIPSVSEGFPNALCEAMAAGLACVSFDFISGPRDIISPDRDGIIVEDGNIDALASAIQDLMLNDEKRLALGTNAIEIRKRLNSEKIGREVLDFVMP